MDVYIKYLNGNRELTEDVEVVKENSRMGFIDMTYKQRTRITEGETCIVKEKTCRKILNFAAIESITIVEEELQCQTETTTK